jgi:hypothetical protein
MTERVIEQANRTKRYADYVQRCREQGLTPTSFRVFAETDDEYDREWEIANYEYDHDGDTNE